MILWTCSPIKTTTIVLIVKKAQELLTKLIDTISVEEINNCINKASKNTYDRMKKLAVCIELHPSFGSSKNTSSTSAVLSAHVRGRSQYPRRWSLPLIRLRSARLAHKFKRIIFASITTVALATLIPTFENSRFT